MPTLLQDFFSNPTSSLLSITCEPWNHSAHPSFLCLVRFHAAHLCLCTPALHHIRIVESKCDTFHFLSCCQPCWYPLSTFSIFRYPSMYLYAYLPSLSRGFPGTHARTHARKTRQTHAQKRTHVLACTNIKVHRVLCQCS